MVICAMHIAVYFLSVSTPMDVLVSDRRQAQGLSKSLLIPRYGATAR